MERVKEVEHDGNIMYLYENGKMRPVETILKRGGRVIKENDGGGKFN
jgi:hypothetical protein